MGRTKTPAMLTRKQKLSTAIMKAIEEHKDPLYDLLSPRERLFANNYLACWDLGDAAEKAGYAKNYGYQMYRLPHVNAYISSIIEKMTVPISEIIKNVSQVANTSLADYIKEEKELYRPEVKMPLAEYISRQQETVRQDKLYLFEADLTDTERQDAIQLLRRKENEILRLQIELTANPKAFRVVEGDPEYRKKYTMDVAKIKDHRAKLRIQRFVVKPDGTVDVRTPDILEAADKMLRLNGKYAEDNAQRAAAINNLDVSKLDDATLQKLIDAGK